MLQSFKNLMKYLKLKQCPTFRSIMWNISSFWMYRVISIMQFKYTFLENSPHVVIFLQCLHNFLVYVTLSYSYGMVTTYHVPFDFEVKQEVGHDIHNLWFKLTLALFIIIYNDIYILLNIKRFVYESKCQIRWFL